MKIAIVGAHRETKLCAPYDDPEWSIWSCSPFNENELPRVDAWFEMHGAEVLDPLKEYRDYLAGLPLVYMLAADPVYPGSKPYPLDRMVERFSPHFFRWTPCYMLALAIEVGPEEIGLWGFSRNAIDGHGEQMLATQHFIRLARDLGIGVSCPAYLDAAPKLYGYDN